MWTHNEGVVSSIPPCVTFSNTIGKESNGKPPHEFHFPRKPQSPVAGFCYARNRLCDAVFFMFVIINYNDNIFLAIFLPAPVLYFFPHISTPAVQ